MHHTEKGSSVTHTEHPAKTLSRRTGAFATLPASLRDRGSGAPTLRLIALLALSFVALLALTAAPAAADQTRLLVNHFGTLNNPSAIAIDHSSGDLYVADTANHRVEKFDAAGNFLLTFGQGVNSGTGNPNLCTNAGAPTDVCQPGTAGTAPGAFEGTFENTYQGVTESRLFLAVDNSPGGEGDLYVGDPGDHLVSKFDSAGSLIATWGNNGPGGTANGQLAGNGAEAFQGFAGIAVGATGTLYVYAFFVNPSGNHEILQNQLFEFEQNGAFASKFAFSEVGGTEQQGLAVDAAGNLFKAMGNGGVAKFDSAGNEIGEIAPGRFARPGAAAFAIEPSSGDLYVAARDDRIDHYASGASDSVAIPFAPTGIDVSSASGDVYLSDPATNQVDVYEEVTIPGVATEAATEVGPHAATLNGTVNPAGLQVTECFFEYLSQAERERNETEAKAAFAGAAIAQCEPAAASIPADEAGHPVQAEIETLKAGAAYHYRLIAANASDAGKAPNPGADLLLHTSPPPSIDEALATEVTATSATLTAEVNPKGFATSCQIEWGATAEPGNPAVPYEHTEACQPEQLGSGTADVSAALHLEGLTEGTTYHWRVLATNPNDTVESSDHTFAFLPPPPHESCPQNEALRTGPSAALPDCRAYEMVTPPFKNGATVGNVTFVGGIPDIAADGQRVIAGTIQCFGGARSCYAHHGDAVGSPYEFSRTAGGWQTTPLAPPATQFPANTKWDYSADSGTALFSMPTPPFGEDDFYLRQPDGSFRDIGPNTPPEEGAKGPDGGATAAESQAATADFSHFVWETPVRWSFDEASTGKRLYEYAGLGNSQPLLVGVSGGKGSHDLISACGTLLGGPQHITQPGTLSADGRTVFFTAAGPCASGSGQNAGVPLPAYGVYARVDGESPAAHTVAITRFRSSAEECPAGEGTAERSCRERTSPSECGSGEAAGEKACREALGKPADALYQGASSDGSKALFTSPQQLTDESTEGSQNLYLYDLGQPDGHHLTAISAGDTSGKGPRVQGVIALSPDGSHAYFVAKGLLAANHNENGEAAQAGANNLYAYQHDAAHPEGHLVFIAALPGSDEEEWAVAPGFPANVTPDGRYLVFASHGHLTPDATSKSGANQVFRYDAQSEQLIRVSVGERGFDDNGNRSAPTPCAQTCSEDAVILQALGRPRSDPTMSDDGSRVFFTSPLALTPGALDDKQIATQGEGVDLRPAYAQNLYEWEREGAGSCPSGRSAGCVFLVSDGHDTALNNSFGGGPLCGFSSVCLLGTDTEGKNVFFKTADSLVPQHTGTQLDFYDARIDGGFAKPAEPEICLTSDSCHGKGTEEGPTPSPSHFEGPEEGPNHPQCAKGFVKRHGKCVVRHERHKGKKHKHRAKHHRKGTVHP